MKDKGLGIAIAFAIIVFGLVWAQTNGFASQPVASSDVTTRDATPTVNDDIDRGFFPGYVWVDQAGPGIYGLVSGTDGAADWNRLDGGGSGGGHVIQEEGIDLPQRVNLNFEGPAVTCFDDTGIDTTTCSSAVAVVEFGNLFADDTAPDAQVLATSGIFEIIEGFNLEGETTSGITLDGASANMTVSAAGVYIMGYSASFSGSANKEYTLAIHTDGVIVAASTTHRTLDASGAVGVAASSAIVVVLIGGEVLDVRAAPTSNNDTISLFNGTFIVVELQDFGADELPVLADDNIWTGSAANVPTPVAIPDCNTTNIDRIQYDTATNTWSCQNASIDLTSEVTGVLPIANGGTGANTAAGARTALDVDQAGTDNSTDVTLAGSLDYITISGQVITRNTVDISDDTNLVAGTGATLTGDSLSVDLGTSIDLTSEVTGDLPVAEGGTGSSTAGGARTNLDVDQAGTDNSTDVTLTGSPNYITISGQEITRGVVDISDDTNLVAGLNLTLTGDSLAVDDSFLFNTGDTGSGVYDFGAATSFELPNGAGGTTVDASGEVTIDTTLESINFFDGTEERVLSPERSFALTVENPDGSEDISIFRSIFPFTVIWEECVLTGSLTPSLGLTLRHGTDRNATGSELVTGGNTITSTTTGDNDVTFNDPTVVGDSFIWMETTTQSGTVDSANCTWGYNIDP